MKRSFNAILTTDLLSTLFCDVNYDSYWAKVSVSKFTPKKVVDEVYSKNNTCVEDDWIEILMCGGLLMVTDNETDKTHEINLKDIEKGLKILTFNYPMQYARIMVGDCDMWDTDAFLQCIVFGKVIYG